MFHPNRHVPKGIELLGSVVWYRSKAKIKNTFKHDYSKTSAPRLYAGGLPLELVEMIIAHVELDAQTLKACSRTCRSWYIVTLPHLYHTLTLRREHWDQARGGLIPFRKLEKMQLLPFVKRLWIRHCYADPRLPSEIFNTESLVYFSALTNIQELGLDRLDLHLFTPQAQLYFGPFIPRLRSLSLISPRGPNRLILYLLALFPNLDDLKIIDNRIGNSPLPDPAPIPQSPPLLQGRLALAWFSGEDFLRDVFELSGGLQFRHMDLFGAEGSRFLLGSGAETLETLRVHPMRWTGKACSQWKPVFVYLSHQPTGCRKSFLRAFDLSKNKSLRSLEIEITVTSNTQRWGDRVGFLGDLLSTVTSPVFSDVVVILQDSIISDPHFLQNTLFRAVRDMCEVKPFRLVFQLGKSPRDGEGDRERLKGMIGAQAAEGGFGPLTDPPVIVSYTRPAWSMGSIDAEHLDLCGAL